MKAAERARVVALLGAALRLTRHDATADAAAVRAVELGRALEVARASRSRRLALELLAVVVEDAETVARELEARELEAQRQAEAEAEKNETIELLRQRDLAQLDGGPSEVSVAEWIKEQRGT